MELNPYRVTARKDLIDFVEEKLDSKVCEQIGKEPERWIEELGLINQLLTREGLSAGIGFPFPEEAQKESQKLGERVFRYKGNQRNLRGVWISRETKRYDYEKNAEIPCNEWAHYFLGANGTLKINKDFSDIPFETFLPENFEPKCKAVKTNKRPILTFDVSRGNEKLSIYAKGAFISMWHLYDPPSYRLTNVSRIDKLTSKEEMERTILLAKKGIKVPTVIGYYETSIEEFLFLQKVDGKDPRDYFDACRKEIIVQDAQMLASLCLLGYGKVGFEDFDDKLFDGKDLYLIDVDELHDIYHASVDFRKVLLNPNAVDCLDRFRKQQNEIFMRALRDSIYSYKKTLTPKKEDMMLYALSFFKKIGWDKPTKAKLNSIITFPENYTTLDVYMSMMSEE